MEHDGHYSAEGSFRSLAGRPQVRSRTANQVHWLNGRETENLDFWTSAKAGLRLGYRTPKIVMSRTCAKGAPKGLPNQPSGIKHSEFRRVADLSRRQSSPAGSRVKFALLPKR